MSWAVCIWRGYSLMEWKMSGKNCKTKMLSVINELDKHEEIDPPFRGGYHLSNNSLAPTFLVLLTSLLDVMLRPPRDLEWTTQVKQKFVFLAEQFVQCGVN